MAQKILILGANGFIGLGLVAALLKESDAEITGFDISSNRLGAFLKEPRFHFTLGDVTKDEGWIEKAVADCDIVLPLVAIANPAIYVKDPLLVFNLDFESNLKVVRHAVKYKKRIIFPSTSEVYGMSPDAEFNEETSPLMQGPISKERWIYSCSKQLLDRVIYAYGTRGQLSFTLFRPFNWIGPLQDSVNDHRNARVVTQFIGNIMRGENLTLVDGGVQKRCFTFIDDGISGLMKIIANKDGAAEGRIFNLGNPKNNFSIADLAGKLLILARQYPKYQKEAAQTKIVSKSASEHYGKGYQDLQNRVPAIGNAKKYLDWEPKFDLDSMLKIICEYHLGK